MESILKQCPLPAAYQYRGRSFLDASAVPAVGGCLGAPPLPQQLQSLPQARIELQDALDGEQHLAVESLAHLVLVDLVCSLRLLIVELPENPATVIHLTQLWSDAHNAMVIYARVIVGKVGLVIAALPPSNRLAFAR